MSNLKILAFVIFGFAGLVLGGRLVVSAAMNIAVKFGVSEKIIGLTIVAAGTSLPELATSVIAALKKKSDIAVGNIVGSNIFNIFFILGLSAIVRPLNFNPVFNTEIYLLLIGTLFFLLPCFSQPGKNLSVGKQQFFYSFALYPPLTLC